MTTSDVPCTFATDQICPGQGQDGLRVDGPFGSSGWYPLGSWPVDAEERPIRHCPVWYLKAGLPEAAKARAAVVSERTRVTLCLAGKRWSDEAICTRCRNVGCPSNQSSEGNVHAAVGRLIV
ncbi:MAG: hypothetical protein VKO21_08800 [Candidatus Sericytochromatia bacterium]|nr:hypothetical protein [Candidatus Sericytochromatia bacterium]